MQKIIVLLSLILLSIIPLRGNTMPQVTTSDDLLSIYYDFSDIQVINNNGNYTFALPGFNTVHSSNKPKVLYRNETFIIPPGYEIEGVETIMQGDSLIGHCEYSTPYDFELRETNLSRSQREINPAVQDLAVTTELWPSEPMVMQEQRSCRNLEIASFTVYPVQYDANQDKIYLCKELKINFTLRPSDLYVESREEDYSYVNSMMTLNPPFTASLVTPSHAKSNIVLPSKVECPDYLILSPAAFASEAFKFADWKRNMGYNTNVRIVNAEEVREPRYLKKIVTDYYTDHPRLSYLLLLGDGYKIPPFEGSKYSYDYTTNQYQTYFTDYPYGQMSSSHYQDIIVGRFPASTVEELGVMINKTIEYEKNPKIDASSTHEYTYLLSEFDRGGAGNKLVETDKSYFIWDCEYLRSYLAKFSSSTIRHEIYVPDNASLQRYPNGQRMFSNGSLSPQVNVGASYLDFKKAFRNGASTILMHGHGNVDSFSSAGFGVSSSYEYTQGTLPIVFSIVCLNGLFYHDSPYLNKASLIKTMLGNSKSGTVGAIGANQISWALPNSYLSAALYQHLYPPFPIDDSFKLENYQFSLNRDGQTNPEYPYLIPGQEEIIELGALLSISNHTVRDLFSEGDMLSDTYNTWNLEVYHCLGDPALKIQKKKPKKEALKISYSNGRYYYNDWRIPIARDKYNKVYKMPYLRNQDITDLLDEYSLSVPCYGYVPEFVDKSTLSSYASQGKIVEVMDKGNVMELRYESSEEEVEVEVMDIYGMSLHKSAGYNHYLEIPKFKGFTIVVLRANGTYLDSRTINTK